LKTLYLFLKVLTRIAFRLYYPRTTVLHAERLHFEEPCILISNHPNTLVDALQVASRANKLVFFLANASLYANPVMGKLLRNFYTIPIRRRGDNPDAKIDNKESFKECIQFLTSGGCLWIAPEGGSDMHRKLRPIKTGTARIALATEAANNFQLNLRIQPVGLTYERPNYFRTGLIVHAGEPIYAKDWQADFEADEFKTAKKLTRTITERMRGLLIDTKDETKERLLFQLETLNRSQGQLAELEIYNKSQKMLSGLRQLSVEQREQLREDASTYFKKLKELEVIDAAVYAYQQNSGVGGVVLKLVIGFPLFLYGFLNNMLPVFTTLGIVRKLNLYVGYNSTVKVLGGLIFFPLFYVIQGLFFVSWSENWWLLLLYWASLIPAGLFAWDYKNWAKHFWQFHRLRKADTAALWQKRKLIEQWMEKRL